MVYNNKIKLLSLFLIFISNFSFSQSNEIKIRLIGNCGLYLTDGKSNIYIDFPYKSGAHNYMEYDQSEINNLKKDAYFIFTHKHSDHYSKKLLKKTKGNAYGPWNVKELSELNSSINDFNIQAFKTKHRFTFKHYSYLITWHNKKIFLSGDTESAETIGSIKEIDWAFVPVWLILDSKEKNIKIDTKMYGLYHIGPGDHITSDNPKILMMDKKGEEVLIGY